jgi:predicted DNA-binding transcriptional regulator AlpA
MKKITKRTPGSSPKKERAEDLAKLLGVSPSSVWQWRRDGTLPKNRRIRDEFVRWERK